MSEFAVEFENVWKKFRKGERYDSLRDLIPAVTRRLFSANSLASLKPKEFWALHNVTFDLRRGDSIGIIGPNGSGKSTILKLLSGILRPDRGVVRVNGRSGCLIELGAGFHLDLTGRENIYLNGTILGMKRTEIDKKFDSIVEFAGLSEFLDTPVKRYSSGMNARLGFSIAAHIEPEVLIVDEVLSVGDYHFQEKCFAKMQEFTRNGTTLIFVSHNLAAVSSLCKSALLLKYGEPVYQGDVRTAIGKYYSFYEEDDSSKGLKVVSASLGDDTGSAREVFEPGARAHCAVVIEAISEVKDAHAVFYLHTQEGERLFFTTSSQHSDAMLNLSPGERAELTFDLSLNLQGGIFRLGFAVTDTFDQQYLYSNMNLKQVVMTGNAKSQGLIHLSPTVRLMNCDNEQQSLPQTAR
jgi:ABC-type polysaccharide/polyol phosphate transport system ATPase subunit